MIGGSIHFEDDKEAISYYLFPSPRGVTGGSYGEVKEQGRFRGRCFRNLSRGLGVLTQHGTNINKPTFVSVPSRGGGGVLTEDKNTDPFADKTVSVPSRGEWRLLQNPGY